MARKKKTNASADLNSKKKFKVLTGQHRQNGKVYTEGDIIESTVELDKTFSNKFKRVTTETVADTGEYSLQQVRNKEDKPVKGKWNIIDGEGNVVNDKPMTKVKAQAEIIELTSED